VLPYDLPHHFDPTGRNHLCPSAIGKGAETAIEKSSIFFPASIAAVITRLTVGLSGDRLVVTIVARYLADASEASGHLAGLVGPASAQLALRHRRQRHRRGS